ncbi:hypothetical protein FB566_1062 [Stackebrandtia endophytica]|uniref:Uncharacterized protein n=1 Tax=Stackebrandtia endophytica TaxID=1496996 RepID=A0A543AST9_9ACTN|nr:hypothetical protein [Stackebrandtia endophytica]TQL75555.1 hypothetical protein FB566_1062 [Stackebrandtia endophytica]
MAIRLAVATAAITETSRSRPAGAEAHCANTRAVSAASSVAQSTDSASSPNRSVHSRLSVCTGSGDVGMSGSSRVASATMRRLTATMSRRIRDASDNTSDSGFGGP